MRDHVSNNFGWKSYRLITKKAMEQELSWSGLVISLSIAFFIVAGCATLLRTINTSLETASREHIPSGERLLRAGSLAKNFVTISAAEAAAPDYQAQAAKETEYLTLAQGQSATKTITLKNTGAVSWKPGTVTFETGPYLKTLSRVAATSWPKFYEPTVLSKEVKPGQSVSLSFAVKAPTDLEGTVQENFQLVASSRPVPGSLTRHFITIAKPAVSAPIITTPASSSSTAPAGTGEGRVDLCAAMANPAEYSQCNTPLDQVNSNPSAVLAGQPIIRVGLFSTLASQRITSNGFFDVYAGKDILFSGLTPNTVLTVSYNLVARQYNVIAPNLTRSTALPVKLVSRAADGVMTLLDYRSDQKPQDNRFRSAIEFRYTEPANKVWVINELPIENYLKGLGETTNASPVEFQKVMATAARTYAMYHYLRGVASGITDGSTKHADDHFHVDATYDQVYRGYNSELRLTGLTQAVDATRGMTVTYNNQPIVAAYFSNSDGRTRSYQEVWGGSGNVAVPYLISVLVPEDVGKVLYGHGVGMSARGALLMVNQGKSWSDVLKYFYTGTSVQRMY